MDQPRPEPQAIVEPSGAELVAAQHRHGGDLEEIDAQILHDTRPHDLGLARGDDRPKVPKFLDDLLDRRLEAMKARRDLQPETD